MMTLAGVCVCVRERVRATVTLPHYVILRRVEKPHCTRWEAFQSIDRKQPHVVCVCSALLDLFPVPMTHAHETSRGHRLLAM